ncbi:MAG: IS1634 family transposase [Candidatus Thorarchaeota archaeon]|nr:MAG: IS1634 family transposase [Candidatus Thorarchaeota archaeon]
MTGVDIHTERIDDVPLLLYFLQQMGIQEIFDSLVDPHGNRQGLSVGWLTSAWLSYIVSESDHRMSEVESWAEAQQEMLSELIPQPVRSKDFTDDRLADVLSLLSDDKLWEEVESKLSERLIVVYDLEGSPVRVDSTTVSVYHDSEGNTLFRRGHSKDHRPDLAQFKVMLGSLDPMGMPLATLVVSGDRADDRLYIPAISKTRQSLGEGGRLYIGDCKMGSLENRVYVHAGGDYYLMPLAQIGKASDLLKELLDPVWKKAQPLQRLYRETNNGDREVLALGFEIPRSQKAYQDGKLLVWQERMLVVYSPSLARRARRGFNKRLEKARDEILWLTPPRRKGRKQFDDLDALQKEVQRILKKHRVEGLLEVRYTREIQRRSIRKYRDRPACIREKMRYVVEVSYNEEAIRKVRRTLGWRIYVTNAPKNVLPVEKAVLTYRQAPRIERNFSRLKGRPLGVHPLYVKRDNHACGMVRLLSLALRLLTLVEHEVREGLKAAGETLSRLYAGNPKRKTDRPTTERLLKAFRGITLTVVHLPDQTIRHVTPLSQLQKRILALLGLSTSIYEISDLSKDAIPP